MKSSRVFDNLSVTRGAERERSVRLIPECRLVSGFNQNPFSGRSAAGLDI